MDQLPILGREEFLFVRRTGHKIENLLQGTVPFAGAGTVQAQVNLERVQVGMSFHQKRFADQFEAGTRRIQVHRHRRNEPVFDFFDELLFLFVLLDGGKALKIGVRLELGRDGSIGPEKEHGDFFETFLAASGHDPGPPLVGGEVLASQVDALKIIFEQEPGALGISTLGKGAQDVRALLH